LILFLLFQSLRFVQTFIKLKRFLINEYLFLLIFIFILLPYYLVINHILRYFIQYLKIRGITTGLISNSESEACEVEVLKSSIVKSGLLETSKLIQNMLFKL
jgi:hypothetical protein